MKKAILLIFTVLTWAHANGQCTIPNGGFDNWKTFENNDGSGTHYDYPEDWSENFGNPIRGRYAYDIGFFYKYAEEDANGNAVLLKRHASNKQNGFVRFACDSMPSKLKGRYKFSGADNASETDTLIVAVHFSTISDSLTLAQLHQGYFHKKTYFFKTTLPIDAFTDFEIDLGSASATEDYDYVTVQLLIVADNFINGSTATAVIDDLELVYPSYTRITKTVCDRYLSPSGKVLNESGTYQDTVFTEGITEIFIIQLTVNSLNAELDVEMNKLLANVADANYRWINCATAKAISSETGQTFTAAEPGSYAVIIDDGVCVDTSACETISASVITALPEFSEVKVYPNPTNDYITIQSEFNVSKVNIYNANGVLVISEKGAKRVDISSLPSGSYVLKVLLTDNKWRTNQIIVNQ